MLLSEVLEELFLSRRKLPSEMEVQNLKIIRQRRTDSGSCTSSGLNTAITFLLQKNWVATPVLVMFKDKLYLGSIMIDGTWYFSVGNPYLWIQIHQEVSWSWPKDLKASCSFRNLGFQEASYSVYEVSHCLSELWDSSQLSYEEGRKSRSAALIQQMRWCNA